MKSWILFFCVAFCLFTQEELFELVPSTADEVASLLTDESSLIGGLISPLSGQLCLRSTDLFVKGAQNLSLSRVYIPPGISVPKLDPHREMEQYLEEKEALFSLQKNYKGWVFAPQIYLKRVGNLKTLLSLPSGACLTFQHKSDGSESTLSSLSGISNISQDVPQGHFDLRNVRFKFEDRVKVFFPNGLICVYKQDLLEKEILPNGKVICYFYNDDQLVRIESKDKSEKYVYASITVESDTHKLPYFDKRHPREEKCGSVHFDDVNCSSKSRGERYHEYLIKQLTSSTGDVATFSYETVTRNRLLKKKCGTFQYELTFPSPLKTASTPFYRCEGVEYQDFQISSYSDRSHTFQCTYENSRVKTLSFPVGPNDAMEVLYTMAYGDVTTATRADGVKFEYRFTKDRLPESVLFFAPDGTLKKQKLYQWYENHWLKSIEWKDGSGKLFKKQVYEDYDPYGNPRIEKNLGDELEETLIKREYSQDNRNLLVREETEEGKIVIYEYLKNTNLVTQKRTYDKKALLLTEAWNYDSFNNLIEKITDGITQKTITRYVLRGQPPFLHMPEWVEESYCENGHEYPLKKTRLSYDKWGNVAKEEVYDAKGIFAFTIARGRDEQGNLLSETNPLQTQAIASYNLKGQCVAKTNFSNRLKTMSHFDRNGRLRKLEEINLETNAKHVTTHEYNKLDRCIQTTDYLNNATQFGYDPISGEVILTIGPDGAKATSVVDGFGRKISRTDPNGNTTQYRNNANNDPVKIVYPNGFVEVFRYYKNGNLKTLSERDGLITKYAYDIFDRVTEKKYEFKGEEIAGVTFEYEPLQLKRYTDKTGLETKYSYDGAGRKIAETTGDRTTLFGYDGLSRLETVQKEEGLCIHYKRDFLDRVFEETKTDKQGTVLYKIGYVWDPDGNQTEVIRYPHNLAASETFQRDAFGRIVEHRDALGATTQTVYEENNHVLTSVTTDPNGIATSKSFDPYGREARLQIGSLYTKEQMYDPAGNLLQIKEGSILTRFTYNNENLMESVVRGYRSPHARTTMYMYSPGDRLATKTKPDGTVLAYQWTPFGYLETLISSDGSVSQTLAYTLNGYLTCAADKKHVVKRDVDDFGNILKETIDGIGTTKTYDKLDRLKSITLPDGSAILYEYDPVYLRSVTRNQCIHVYEEYDLSGCLIRERLPFGLGENSLTWNPNGTIKMIESPYFKQTLDYDVGSRVRSVSSDGTYEYNDRSEMTLEKLPQTTLTYDYDLHSNRKQKNERLRSFNNLDEPADLEHDVNGNLKQHGKFALYYDALNRLIEANSDDTQITFDFDALDRCISKKVNGAQELYLYHKTEELGSFYLNGIAKELKIPGLYLKPIALEQQGQTSVSLCDYHGNIRRLIDPKAQITDSFDYTAFGEESSVSSQITPWRYAAKRLDSDLGLYNFGKRWYDPNSGRWITTDPAGFEDGINLYAYLYNDPLNHLDPDGRYAVSLFCLSWGGAAVLSNPIGWAIGGLAVAALAVSWTADRLSNSNYISPTTGSMINTIVGGVAGSMITYLPQYIPIEIGKPYTGSTYMPEFGFIDDTTWKKEGSVDPSLPSNPDDLLKRPGWKETTHPEAGKHGRRTFENKETGEKLEHDKGKPGHTGHKAHDHYHRPNPNSSGRHDEYLDGNGNPVRDQSDHSHIYHPNKVWWK